MNLRPQAILRSTVLTTAGLSIALASGCGGGDTVIIEDALPVDVQVSADTVTSGSRIMVSADVLDTGGVPVYAWAASGGGFSDPTAQSTM